MTIRRTGWLAAAAVVMLAAGCQSSKPAPHEIHGEVFPPDDQPRALQNVTLAQTAAGARADATLYSMHFDQAGVNSLGRQKLDLMLEDNSPVEPLVVYLDLPADGSAAPARTAVVAYLKERGLTEKEIRVEDGPNPHTTRSAAKALTDQQALQAAPVGAPVPTPTTPPPSGSGAMGSSYGH